MLDLDYVRQAAALGVHRTATDLLAYAATFVERSDGLLTYIRQRGVAANTTVAEAQHARVVSAFRELKQAADESPRI